MVQGEEPSLLIEQDGNPTAYVCVCVCVWVCACVCGWVWVCKVLGGEGSSVCVHSTSFEATRVQICRVTNYIEVERK